MAGSRRLRGARRRESSDVIAPVAVGVLRPSVIFPAGWRDWTPATRRAVLAHEFAHLRRHDVLVAAFARLVQCVLWFHPLTWVAFPSDLQSGRTSLRRGRAQARERCDRLCTHPGVL